jgi:hypothetical protein
LVDTYLVVYTYIRLLSLGRYISCFLYWHQMCYLSDRYVSCFLFWHQMC